MNEFLNYNICNECLDEEYLVNKIDSEGVTTKCHYCQKNNKTIKMSKLVELIDNMHRTFIVEKEVFGDFDYDDDEMFGYSPEELITVHTGLDFEIVDKIVDYLSQEEQYDVVKDGAAPMYDNTLHYEYKYIYDFYYSDMWNTFCHILKHESRFFSKVAIEILDNLFNKLDSLYSTIGIKPIRSYGNNDDEKYFYRARKVHNKERRKEICLNPENELGPPNVGKSKFARMNPTGISVLYGALLRDTCVDELRLSAGEMAVTAKFEITRPIQILDLTVFNKMHDNLSYFDPEHDEKLNYVSFIQRFGMEISAPINKNTKELDYLPTQAFAEYLNDHYEPKIDAVIYNSAQNTENMNIVFLNNITKYFDKKNYEIINSRFYDDHLEGKYYALFEKPENQIVSENNVTDSQSNDNLNKYIVKFVENSVKIHVAEKITTDCKTYLVKKYF